MTLPADAPRVLVADDQPDVIDALRLLLHPEGIQTDAAQSPAAVMAAIAAREYDVLLLDLNYARDTTSGREGLDLVSRIRAIDPSLPVLVMTGWATLDIAVEALRYGVRDFVQKPWENDRLLASVREQAEQRRAARRLAARHAREQAEAREIQRALLPHPLPSVPGWDLAARCEPAESVGGDTFDVISLPGGLLGLSLADVAGKGVPAALLAANLQAAVRAAAARGLGPSGVCGEVNRAVCASLSPWRFVTFFYGVLDTATGLLRYCNAGHLPPLVATRRRGLLRLEPGGCVLGLAPESAYEEGTVCLEPGDRMLIYTDGLTESVSAGDEEFGEERLAGTLGERRWQAGGETPAAAADVLGRVFDAVQAFGNHPAQDDQTALLLARVQA